MKRRHVLHLLHSFSTGGMENVVVQLINTLPPERYRHTVVALTDIAPEFAARITVPSVETLAIGKAPGQPFPYYPAAYRLFRRLAPDVLHTCNLAAMEFAPVAALAGIPRRIHAEHGWDVADPDGSNRIYRMYRLAYRPFIHAFITVSSQLHDYFLRRVHVPAKCLHLIPNGVDTRLFRPAGAGDQPPADYPFRRQDHWVIGTVGRLATIKNQPLLARAFVRLVSGNPPQAERLRLAIVGEGELGAAVQACLAQAGMLDRLWMPGNRPDIPEILRAFDCFTLPSLAEGTSCSLQEAMATALPSVVTDVGGNRELLENGRLGDLVPSGDEVALADALVRLLARPAEARIKGQSARLWIERNYALDAVMRRYAELFES